MGEVGAPHEDVDGDGVAELQGQRVADEAEAAVLEDVLAGLHGERAVPVLEDLVVVVHEPDEAPKPARVGLGEVEADVGEAIEDAGGDELRDAVEGPVAAGALGEGDGVGQGARPRAAAIFGGRGVAEVAVRRDPHADVEGGLPELVVLRLGRAAAVGELLQ